MVTVAVSEGMIAKYSPSSSAYGSTGRSFTVNVRLLLDQAAVGSGIKFTLMAFTALSPAAHLTSFVTIG